MDFSPNVLLGSDRPIPSHAVAALLVTLLGAWQLLAAKGTGRHRAVGWLFVAGMAYVALSGLFISTIGLFGYFSPIHLLIPVTVLSLWTGVRAARRGDVAAHRSTMVSLFVLALVVTGAFTLVPGRIMHGTVFGAEAGR